MASYQHPSRYLKKKDKQQLHTHFTDEEKRFLIKLRLVLDAKRDGFSEKKESHSKYNLDVFIHDMVLRGYFSSVSSARKVSTALLKKAHRLNFLGESRNVK